MRVIQRWKVQTYLLLIFHNQVVIVFSKPKQILAWKKNSQRYDFFIPSTHFLWAPETAYFLFKLLSIAFLYNNYTIILIFLYVCVFCTATLVECLLKSQTCCNKFNVCIYIYIFYTTILVPAQYDKVRIRILSPLPPPPTHTQQFHSNGRQSGPTAGLGTHCKLTSKTTKKYNPLKHHYIYIVTSKLFITLMGSEFVLRNRATHWAQSIPLQTQITYTLKIKIQKIKNMTPLCNCVI